MALPDISPCRYCKTLPVRNERAVQVQTENGVISRPYFRLRYPCPAADYAKSVLGEKEYSDERLMIKNWNASNDLNGPDIIEPTEV